MLGYASLGVHVWANLVKKDDNSDSNKINKPNKTTIKIFIVKTFGAFDIFNPKHVCFVDPLCAAKSPS